jgi:hypothetical protein
MAFSWDGLMEQLGECKKATIAANRAGDKGVEQAQSKINAMTARLAETTYEHQKEMEEMERLSNGQLRDVEAKAEKESRSVREGKEKAVARIKAAEERKIKAEAQSKSLEIQMRELCKMIDQQARDSDTKCLEIQRRTDSQVEKITKTADKRVEDLSAFAEDVRLGALGSMEEMQGQHARGITKSDERATVRSRFQEMCTLTKMLEEHKMSQKAYEESKARIMGTWHAEWDKSTATPTNAKSNPLTPLSANCLSSVNDTPNQQNIPVEDILKSNLVSSNMLNKLDL